MKALIVEDHSETRDWLIALAEDAFPGASPEGASTLEQARALVAEKTFKLALVDISLPDGSGIDFVREVTEQSPDTYCVMATIHDDDAHLFPALQAGAQGYLLKEQPREKLLVQLKGIVQGEPPLSPGIARRIMQHFQREPIPAPGVALSERESEVLALTAKGLRRGEVAQTLGISANTVAGHLKNVYRKLNISTRAEAALEASRRGLVKHGR
ncbi:MAG TPA: response regulator transcription factor [Gammaproteobacteria bacterium]